MKKKEITEYLKNYGTIVKENEEFSYVELMMDDHKCISWYGTEYYIPDGSTFCTTNDWEIFDYLVNNHQV